MNIYKTLNEMINYIENNLDNIIEYKELANIMNVNENTMQRVFGILCDISISDYIRKRRLTKAGSDLYLTNDSILDIAIKYQYESGTSFSRAFERFHGIKPSKVKENPNSLKIYPMLEFEENQNDNFDTEYSIIEQEELILYGIGVLTTEEKIKEDAPKHFDDMMKKYYDKFGVPDYAITVYKDRNCLEELEYWVLYTKNYDKENFKKKILPASKWLKFEIASQEASDIQKATQTFYEKLMKSIDYTISSLPDLEYYHDEITEFLIPIEG